MERLPRSTDPAGFGAIATATAGLVALVALAATVSPSAAQPAAHEHAAHIPGGSISPSTDFATPLPGSYSLPALGDAADGDVLTSAALPVRLHTLFGADAVLLSFVYTQCSDGEGCPLATAVLHTIGTRLAREPELLSRLRLLSLSFDPERDTPEAMRDYGESFHREGLDWRFLTTASEEELAPLLSAYRQTRVPEVDESGQETGQFAHLLRVFLIDRERSIRQVYSTSLLEPDALIADVKTLLLEQAPGAKRAPLAPETQLAAGPAARRSGDDRSGYDRVDYTSQSLPLAARRGRATDLFDRVKHPPLGLPPVPVPADNPLSPEKVALGRRLFFERRLSHNDTISCAMCHVPEQGFTSNAMATAVGIEGRSVRRNSPTLYNSAYLRPLFHDGRETSLEQQIWGPLLARNEMGNPSIGAVLLELGRVDDYADRFERAFPGRGLTMSTLGMALASYERTLISGDSAFDRYQYAGEADALSPAAARGFALFTGAAGCATCHTIESEHALFSDGAFHNTGVGYDAAMGASADGSQLVQAAPGVQLDVPRAIVAQVSAPRANDLGRYEITRDPADRWRYRTPTLRNVALSAPYMHDGSLATLRDVVEFYRRGGVPNEGLDPLVRPLPLSDTEAAELAAFLESLTGSDVETLVADAFAAPVGDATDGAGPGDD